MNVRKWAYCVTKSVWFFMLLLPLSMLTSCALFNPIPNPDVLGVWAGSLTCTYSFGTDALHFEIHNYAVTLSVEINEATSHGISGNWQIERDVDVWPSLLMPITAGSFNGHRLTITTDFTETVNNELGELFHEVHAVFTFQIDGDSLSGAGTVEETWQYSFGTAFRSLFFDHITLTQ